MKACAAASEHIFYVEDCVAASLRNGRLLLKDINVRLLLKENVQLIFFYVEDCVAASGNISMFFNEHAAACEKILTTAFERKKCAAAS